MEGWEDQIDVDDSDLHSVLRFQLSSSSSSPQSLHHHLRPCSKIPSSQTFKPISSISCSQPLPCTHNSHKNQNEGEEHLPKFFTSRFRIPGPAGAIQAAMRRNSAICASKRSLFEEGGSDDLDPCLKEDDEDFKLDAWLYSLSFIGKGMDSSLPYPISLINAERCATKRIPQVVGIVKSCKPNGLGDLFVTLKDPTGTIGAAIHRKTLSEGNICGEISVGCVFILKQVVAFCPAHSACYLNITLKNVVKLIAKDCGPPEKQLMPTSSFMFGAECNGKQLPAELSEGDRSFNSRKIAKITADVEPSRSFTCEKTTNSRKEFHPVNLPGNTFAAAIASVNTTAKPVKPATIMGEPRRLISKASVTEWTDEQLEKLFSEYEDDVELVRPAI